MPRVLWLLHSLHTGAKVPLRDKLLPLQFSSPSHTILLKSQAAFPPFLPPSLSPLCISLFLLLFLNKPHSLFNRKLILSLRDIFCFLPTTVPHLLWDLPGSLTVSYTLYCQQLSAFCSLRSLCSQDCSQMVVRRLLGRSIWGRSSFLLLLKGGGCLWKRKSDFGCWFFPFSMGTKS